MSLTLEEIAQLAGVSGSTEVIIHSPQRPYPKLLLSSLPKVGVKHTERRLRGIPGGPPMLLNPPPFPAVEREEGWCPPPSLARMPGSTPD